MNFFNPATMRRLLAPRHELSCSWFLWRRLKANLREHGRRCSRESGAFLLGHHEAGSVRFTDFVLYDDLDPHALESGIVRFDGRYFGDLWAICKSRRLTVVADVHVHPGESAQSASDRDHPMICQAGHIALILPCFATGTQRRRYVGIYRYLGGKQWETVEPSARRHFFHVGLL